MVPAVGRLVDLVLDCPDAAVLARFWASVLDRRIEHHEDGWIYLDRGDDGHRLSFQEVESYSRPEWPGQGRPQRVHLDVLVTDLDVAESSVIAMGATPISDVLDPGPKQWRFFTDPAGHPFCLVTSTP